MKKLTALLLQLSLRTRKMDYRVHTSGGVPSSFSLLSSLTPLFKTGAKTHSTNIQIQQFVFAFLQRFLSFSRLPNQNTNSTDQLPSGNKTFSTMSHPYTPQPQQLLPQSVEELLRRICTEQNQPPINSNTRAKLADLGEEEALSILREISPQKIRRSLDGFINYLANMGSPLKRPCLSSRQNCSLTSTDPHSRLLMYPQDDAQTPNIRQEHQMFTPMVADGANGQRHSPQLLALGELEFRKAFLILNYIGDKKLEEAISADEIGRLKNLQMYNFEQQLWNSLGQYNIMEEDRRKCFDWDSGQTHIYHCHVSRSGSYRFKGPYLQETTTHMHRVLGDDNVLMVKFAEEMSDNGAVRMNDDEQYTKYHNIAKEGILVGLRRYYFFVFKDGGKEKKKTQNTSSMKCYFVRLESDASVDKDKTYALSGKTVSEARSVFMHVNTMPTLAKYMARFSLILSKTIKMEVDLADVNIQRIDDIKCQDINGNVVCDDDGQPHIQTDGTGFISEDLALKCPKNVSQGRHIANGNTERLMTSNEHEKKFSEINSPQPPLLIQFRLFNNGSAVKGTFLVNRKLPFRTIQNRPSMIKVETDPRLSNTSTKNSFEIVTTSNKPRKTCLSRNLIALLSYGGIPDNFFMHSLVNAMEEAGGVLSNTRSALKVSLNRGEMDDLNAARMILSGIPLDEPYLQYHLSILMKEEKKSLKAGKLPVEESYYLMGTVDPTGLLEPNEVCIILDNGQISGKVLVYRNPGLHFGDIHILKARYLKALEDIVGNAKYAIFFPCKGPRSLADEMAGGDYDGDMYFVSKNPQLLEHFTQSKPMPPTSSTPHVSSKRPCDFSPQELEEELFNLYLAARFQPSYTIGAAADYWLAIMDRYLSLGDDSSDEKAVMKKKLVQLIEIYYDALDAPKKSGRKIEIPKELQPDMFPHYMEREPKRSFTSTSILGLIYDKVKSNEAEDPPITEVNKLPCFDKAPESCLTKWGELYEKYRQEMSEACKQEGQKKKEAANEIIRKYKQELYEAAEFEESKRSLQELYNDALAIYHVTYDHASKKGKASLCSFAWKVAGAVLCRLHATKQAERSMVCLPSVLKGVLG